MPTLSFQIGEMFPASDPCGRFMTGMAMIANNALRLIAWQNESDANREQVLTHDGPGVGFIAESQHWFPEVRSFVDQLPDDCRQRLGSLSSFSTAGLDAWMRDHRNVTFHYPRLQPDRAAAGKEEMMIALSSAAEIEGAISFNDGHHSVRYGFADEVAVQWLPDADELDAAFAEIATRVITLVHVVELMMRAYLEQRASAYSTS